MEDHGPARGLPSFLVLLRHQLGVILAVLILVLGAAFLYLRLESPTYTSKTVVLLSPAPGNPLNAETAAGGATQLTVALETEAQILRTPAVANVVEEALGRGVSTTGDSLRASVQSNTQMLEISYTSATSEAAQEATQAFADGYLTYRAERARATQQSRIDRLQEQLDEANQSLQEANREAASPNAPASAAQQVQFLVDRVAQLNTSLSSAESVSTDPGTVISEASLPDSSDQRPAWLVLAAAGAIGIVLGFGLALVREWRRDLLRSSADAELAGIPVLADLSQLDVTVTGMPLDNTWHESYRQLRTAIIANAPRPHVLAVSEVSGDATSATGSLAADAAVNLALVLSEARFSVLLISDSSQTRQVESLLEVEPRRGLSEAVILGAPLGKLVRETGGISVLTAGRDDAGAHDLTATSVFGDIVAEANSKYDYVVMAVAPAGSADGDTAMLRADSTLLMFRRDRVTRNLLRANLERLSRLGVRVIGGATFADRSEKAPSHGRERPGVSDVVVASEVREDEDAVR